MRIILSFVILLAGAGYVVVADWYPAVDWLQESPFRLFWPLLACSLAWVIILLGRWRRPDDPAIASWTAFAFAGSLLLFPLLIAKSQQEDFDTFQAEALAELQNETLARLRRIEQEKIDALEKEIPEGTQDRFARYRGKIDALTLGKLRLIDSRMQKDVEERARAYEEALTANPTAGPNSWLTFRSLDELDKELEAHRTLYAATRSFTQFIEEFEDTYTTAIEEANLQPPADRIAIAEMERVLQSWERSNAYEIRKLDVVVLGTALNALQILRDEWGQWSYSPREEQISFENPTAEQAFLEAAQRLKAAIAEVQKLSQPETPPQE